MQTTMFNYVEALLAPKLQYNGQWLKSTTTSRPPVTSDFYHTLGHTSNPQPQQQQQHEQRLRQRRATRDKQFKMVADDNVQQNFATQLNNDNNHIANNNNINGSSKNATATTFPSTFGPITPVISQILATPMKTSATAASNAITSTRSPYMLLTTSAVTAVTSTLVNSSRVDGAGVGASGAIAMIAPSPPSSSSLNISFAMTSPTAAAAAVAAVASSTPATTITPSTGSVFFEGDLLPTVFVTGNGNGNSRNNTTTVAGMDDDDNLNSFYFYETEQFAVLWILFTIIVLGNSAVLFVMFMNKNRKSRMNYFIKQLALADLCVGLLNVLTDIIWRITISWRAGNIACKIIRFSQVCVTYSSTYVLVAMSIDRYDAITHPMNFSKSWKRARHLVAGAWIVSALFSLPILMLYEEKNVQGQTQCWIELGSPLSWQIYMGLVSATLFAFPALIISACYAIIVKTIWAKGSIFVPAERAGFGSNTTTRRASSRGIIPRAKVKTVKMTFVIVIVFIVCWSPYIIFDLLQVFGHIPQTQTNIAIATFIQSLAPLNSAANPLIYCLFSSTVFRTLSRYPPFKWFTCCCKSYRHNSTTNRCNTVGRRLHNSCDSMRTLTTSLTVSRRSNKGTTRVVICERPKSNSIHHNAMSEV
ncbi:cardioacceleratory peptide receptor [Musca domestica]|uniref:Cardioacceleratory peptide receptor n=2 Tax=Musca domestica TaxID=7370 RepID=A0A9J7CSC6_MUSDO|nr:cardioacceleratory peptide receptor [Musca domestica]